MQFDMNRTWAQAVAKVRGNFQLLALIAGVFMLLPSLAAVVAMPEVFALASPDASPQDAEQHLRAILPSFFATMTIILLISLIGYAAMVALVGPGRPTVGHALGRAFKAIPSLVGAFLVFVVGYMIAGLVAAIVVGVMAAVLSIAVGTGGATLLTVAALFVAIGYLLTRSSLLLPVIMLEGDANPLKAYARSWRLTRPARWRIFGFFVLLSIAYIAIVLVLTLALTAIGAVVGESATFLFGIVTGVVGMVAAMLLSAILVSMHDQLAGNAPRGTDGETGPA